MDVGELELVETVVGAAFVDDKAAVVGAVDIVAVAVEEYIAVAVVVRVDAVVVVGNGGAVMESSDSSSIEVLNETVQHSLTLLPMG